MNVLVTGANGNVGTAIIDNISNECNYDFTRLDIVDDPDGTTVIADISALDDIKPAFRDQDAIIHLAGNPSPDTPWDDVLRNNIIGTYNVMRAAEKEEVDKIIFASSIRVIFGYEKEHRPDIYTEDSDVMIDHTDAVRPGSYYAVSKLFGEHLGKYFLEQRDYPTQFFALRIGSVRGGDCDHPYCDAERAVSEGKYDRNSREYQVDVNRLKSTWLSHQDASQLIHKMLQNYSEEYGIFYGISGNDRRWVDISNAEETLGYAPEDNGDDWESPPGY